MLQDQLRKVRARRVILFYPLRQQPVKKTRRCLTAPLLTCLCVTISLIAVASVIVLSLIPMFLSSKDVTLADDQSRALVDLGYGLNITNFTSLTPEQIQSIVTQFENLLKISGKVDGSVQVAVETSLSARSVTTSNDVVRPSQCQDSSANYVRIRFYVALPRGCRTTACRNRARQNVAQSIERLYSSLSIAMSSGNSAQSSVPLNLCSTSVSEFTAVTATTTSATSVASNYPVYSTTAVPGRRKRALRSLARSVSQQRSYMPVAGCLVISENNDEHHLVEDLLSKYGMMKYFPQGIQILNTSNENQTDLINYLQEQKISKDVYNQILLADHSPHQTNLTHKLLHHLQSHYHAWERVVQLNEPMLVLQENIHLDEQLLNTMFPYLMYALPTNFSLFYFGHSIVKESEEKLLDYNDLLWKINGSLWSDAPYIISPQAAATLIEWIYPLENEINVVIDQIAQSQSLDVYMSKQILVQKEDQHAEKVRSNDVRRHHHPSPSIPSIFHFIWLNNDSLPSEAEKFIQLWKEFHPNWTTLIWTKESLIERNFTLFNEEFFQNSMTHPRQASDILRYEIIYQYGGIYVDLDFEPLQNIETLLQGVQAFVAYESDSFICNGIFGATPFHPFIERLINSIKTNSLEHPKGTISQQTGPHYLTKQVKAMQGEKLVTSKDGFQVFAPHLFFPYTVQEKDPGRPYHSSAFAVHHFRPLNDME